MKIHVGLVVNSMDVGGMERCITRIANGLDRDKFRLSVICLKRSGPAAKWIEKADVAVVELGKTSGNSPTLVHRLASHLKKLKIDIVHSHNWATLVESHLAARWAGRLLHVHAERGTVLGPPARHAWRERARALAMRWTVARADAIMCNAYSIADKMRCITKLKDLPITVIPNGLDAPYSPEALAEKRTVQRKQLNIAPTDIVIGSVGRMVPVKNFALAVSSFARIRSACGSKLHFVLVGDGPDRPKLEQLARSLGVEPTVHLIGEQADVWPFYASMDLYLNTSLSEGMSQAILEAMAAGLPVLASDVGDSKRLIRGTLPCGEVVMSPTADTFSQSLLTMLSDPQQLRSYAANSRSVYQEHYSLNAMLKNFESFYVKLWSSADRTRLHGSVT